MVTATKTQGLTPLGERLQEAFDDIGMGDSSMAAQARYIGIGRSLYHQWLYSGVTPGGEKLSRACAKLNLNPQWLLEKAGGKHPGAGRPSRQETEPQQPIKHGDEMNLQQQKTVMGDLMEKMSETTREELLKHAAQEALRRGDIKRIPEWMMGPEWDAKQKIDELQNNAKKKKPSGGGTQ